jgi:hypothetical protein
VAAGPVRVPGLARLRRLPAALRRLLALRRQARGLPEQLPPGPSAGARAPPGGWGGGGGGGGGGLCAAGLEFSGDAQKSDSVRMVRVVLCCDVLCCAVL